MGITVNKRISKNNKYIIHDTIISNHEDLLTFMNVNAGEHKYIKVCKMLEDYINPLILKDVIVTHKKFLSAISANIGGSRVQSSINFWISRGYSLNEAKLKVRDKQSSAGQAFAKKIKENPDLYKDRTISQTAYWIKQGYTEAESKIKVSESQSTFTLAKCIKKYGKEEGTKKFEARQNRWLLSREISRKNGLWDWDSCGKDFKKWEGIHGSGWVDLFINYVLNRKNTKNKSLYYNIKNNQKNLYEYIILLPWVDFKLISQNGLVNYLLNKTPVELKNKWFKKHDVNFIKTKYGNTSYKHDNFYASEGEYIIGEHLTTKGIDFIVHKKYKGTSYLTDFYIPHLKLYIEYMGMNGKDYDEKRKALNKLEFKIIWSSDLQFIKNKINEKIYGK